MAIDRTYPIFRVRWLAVHGLGFISAIQFIQR